MHAYRCTRCKTLNRVPESRAGDAPICGRCKARLETSGAPQEVNAIELEALIESSPVPIVVDFWAPWCGPCRAAAPILDRIARSHAGRVLVLKLNSDEHPETSARHRIQGIPAFVAFRDGAEAGRQVGLLPEAAFTRWVDGIAAS